MPRLTPITKREQVSGDGVEAFDHIIESRGQINAPQSMHMYVPEIARCSNDLSDSLRYRSHLSDHDTELAIITAARGSRSGRIEGRSPAGGGGHRRELRKPG